MDPLDMIMAILALLLGLTVASWFAGIGLYVTTAMAALVAYAYIKAPRRTYPTAAAIAANVSLRGKVAMVTGATSGIGVETARVLALQGAHVFLAARNAAKLETTRATLLKTLPQGTKVSVIKCDLSDLGSVRECAKDFLQQELALHILVNNAGIMGLPERSVTAQNLEAQVGVCHVGHFYLFQQLLPALEKAPARVVVLSSVAHRYHQLEQLLESPTLETMPYHPQVGYGNAKGCNMLFAKAVHEKYYASKHIAAFSVMPGGIFTGLQGHTPAWTMFKWTVVGPFFFKSIEQGAATTMVCALTADPDTEGGEYFDNCKRTDLAGKIEMEAGPNSLVKLWNVTEKLLSSLGY